MDPFGALAAVVLLHPSVLVMFGLARLADGECRSFLTAWAEEGGMTIRAVPPMSVGPAGRVPAMRVIYLLIAVDRQGRLRTGWASIAVKISGGELAARSVEVRWVPTRCLIPRPVGPTSRPAGHPLWDRWVDC